MRLNNWKKGINSDLDVVSVDDRSYSFLCLEMRRRRKRRGRMGVKIAIEIDEKIEFDLKGSSILLLDE